MLSASAFVYHYKPLYIRGLVADTESDIKCRDISFSILFSHLAVKLLLEGISKVQPLTTDYILLPQKI